MKSLLFWTTLELFEEKALGNLYVYFLLTGSNQVLLLLLHCIYLPHKDFEAAV